MVSTYGEFIADAIREDHEYNESAIAKLCAALEQCKLGVEQFKRLFHGKQEFPPTKGMEMAEEMLGLLYSLLIAIAVCVFVEKVVNKR